MMIFRRSDYFCSFIISGDFKRHSLPYLSTTLFTVFLCILTYAQEDTFEVQSIKVYVVYVDSINNLGAQNNGFLHFVEGGVIAKRNRKILGGYSVYMLMNEKKDTVYRIEYNGGVDFTANKTYYYKDNRLIFARIQLMDKKETFYIREELYKDTTILLTNTKSSKKALKHEKETALSLFEDGQKYLADYMNTTSHY